MKKLISAAVLLISSAAWATPPLEETLVSASRIDMPARQVGSSVSVLTSEDIEARGSLAIQDVLRTLPSIAVSNSGGVGKLSALRIRGEESFRTLILVDGVDYSDPTTTQVQTPVQHLLVSDIERVEVLRGPQGMMYGADAGGVINIITRKAEGEPEGSLQAETGRYGTRTLSGGVRGDLGLLDYALSASRVETDGFNARTDDTVLRDDDGYENTTLNATLGLQLSQPLRLELVARDVDADNEFDRCFTPSFTAINNCTSQFEQKSHRLNASWTDERLVQRLSYQRQDIYRENFAGQDQSFLAEGGLKEWQYFGSLALTDAYKLVWGIDRETQFVDSSSPKQERDNTGSYAELQADIDNTWYFSIGTRLDDNEDFGDHWSHRATSAYLFLVDNGTIKLRASYGTGFRAPSLFEIAYNNGPFARPPASTTNLTEESSKGYDLGVDYFGENGTRVSVGYFDQRIEDAIDFDLATFSGYLQPKGESESRGWELSADIPLEPRTTLVTNYTYNDTEDTAGKQRVRRPKQITNIGIDHRIPQANVSVFMNYRFVRDAIDNRNVELPDYQVLNVTLNWQASESIAVYLRGENITGNDYTEVTGFNVAGAATYAGVRFTF